jgi:MoaA/NifB/PqqE/SkfB family radical SAM enzyme
MPAQTADTARAQRSTDKNHMNLQYLKQVAQSRDVYLWGARQLGLSMLNSLAKEGVDAKGFLDSSPDLQGRFVLGRPVLNPKEVLAKPPTENFIVITSGFYANEISDICQESGFLLNKDFVAAEELQIFDYQIDVSGTCNLRCISCPRGNFNHHAKSGFMSADVFKDVLKKIKEEDPLVGAVALYNWGEPLLNPELPQIVDICNQFGIDAAISSNLNIIKDFSDTVKAKPTWFRVSTSGYGSSYEVTHTGGKWELFLKNMHKLKKFRELYHPNMGVEVFYHIYKDRSEDYKAMAKLCEDLNFTLRVRHAALAPLDNIEAIIKGKPVNQAIQQTQSLQMLTVSEAMDIAKETKNLPCPYQRCLWITWDLKIMQCMEWYNPLLTLTDQKFLEVPIQTIKDLRYNGSFCKYCKSEAIHRCFLVFGDESLVQKRNSLSQIHCQ